MPTPPFIHRLSLTTRNARRRCRCLFQRRRTHHWTGAADSASLKLRWLVQRFLSSPPARSTLTFGTLRYITLEYAGSDHLEKTNRPTAWGLPNHHLRFFVCRPGAVVNICSLS